MIQILEPRRLLSGVTTSLSAGVLTVRGTAHSDDIHIDVLQNGVTVKDAGVVIFSTPISSLDVYAGIVVKARNGNDTVFVNSNEAGFRTTVWGDAGKDTLTILSFHGQGGLVHGGSGDDTITTDTEITGSSVGAEIFGGSGQDKISATNGAGGAASSVEGGLGNDRINVTTLQFGTGTSVVHGGGGDDLIHALDDPSTHFAAAVSLFGDAGKDHLFGGGGDDALDGGLGRDQVDGGAGTDTAVNSTQDTFTNVETFI